jgi:hypothetical protein
MRWNTDDVRKVQVRGTELKDVERFTYLGSMMSKTSGTEEDAGSRIGKDRAALASLNTIWRSRVYRRETKIRLYNVIVDSTLLYGSECRLRVFHHRCLRRILNVFYPNLPYSCLMMRIF